MKKPALPRLAAAALLLISWLWGTAPGPTRAAPPAGLVINEILADPAAGLDGDANGDGVQHPYADEFVEIFNGTGAEIDLSGWTLSDSVTERHTFAPGTVVAAGCAIVVFGGGAPSGAFGNAVVQTATSGLLSLNNGGDTVTLSDGAATAATYTYGLEGGEDQSLTRSPDATGPDPLVGHATAAGSGGALFSPGTRVDGSPFAGCSGGDGFGACGDTATPIHDVQGDGLTSPMEGASGVVIEGVVVGDFQDTDLGGFFLQQQNPDANPATSEGIWVQAASPDVSVGQIVRLQGDVAEVESLTQIGNVTRTEICQGTFSAGAAPVSLPLPDAQFLERYEGMAVSLQGPLSVTANDDLGPYGALTLSNERLMQPTGQVAPGAAAADLQAANDLNRILLDDGSRALNPDPIRYPNPALSADNTLRLGDTLQGIVGVLSAGGSGEPGTEQYRLHPLAEPAFAGGNPRPPAPTPAAGGVRVVGFNLSAYFDGDGQGGGFEGPPGAATLDEYTRQRAKVVSAVLALSADVVGLIGIENDGIGPNSAAHDLVEAINAAAPPGASYAIVDPGAVLGEDETAVGLLYRVETLSPVGAAATTLDVPFDQRPPLAQTFAQRSTGERWTVAVLHMAGRDCAAASGADLDAGDGQGCYNATRVQMAQSLTAWLDADPTASGDPDRLIVGDLNAYSQEDPVAVLVDAGYDDLIAGHNGPDAYTVVREGQAGASDGALANAGMAAQVSQAAIWHVNADEPAALDYRIGSKSPAQQASLYSDDPYRSSGHDPVIVDLDLASERTLSIAKTRLGTGLVDQGERVGFSIVLTNESAADVASVMLTDTLPANTTFERWLTQPAGAEIHAGQLTWSGTLPGNGAVELRFEARHTGGEGERVTNVAVYSYAGQTGSAEATLFVRGDFAVHLPAVLREWQPTSGFAYGIQAHGDLGLPQIAAAAQDLGLSWVKQQVRWEAIEGTPGDYGWAGLDAMADTYNAAGLKVLYSVTAAPEWARPGMPGVGPPDNYRDYAAFMSAMAEHFQGRVHAYEVWNEPNLKREWDGVPLSAADYVQLLRGAYAAIKAADPEAIVVSAAPTPSGINDGIYAIDDRVFVQAMYEAGLRETCDAVGAHPYGYANPPEALYTGGDYDPTRGWDDHRSFFYRNTMQDYYQIMAAYGDAGKEIWATEFGWGTVDGMFVPPNPGLEYMADINEGQQADYTVRAFQWAQEWGHAGTMFLWNLNFWAAAGPYSEMSKYSILRADWSPRPAYIALRDMPK